MKKTLFTKILCTGLIIAAGITHSMAQGVMTTLVGDTLAGYSGDGGPANIARINAPNDVCTDPAGNIYIVDRGNSVIRKITKTTGKISTIAGNGTVGYTGDGGPATSALLNSPGYICLDAAENIYISDNGNSVIRKISAATGVIKTYAGSTSMGYNGDGGPAAAAMLNGPMGICVDAAGNLYFADMGNNCIRKVTAATGVITTIAGNGTPGYSGDGGLASAALLWSPLALAISASGDLYFSDQAYGYNSYIRKISAATGMISTIAGTGGMFSGDGGPALLAGLGLISGICVDGHGDIYCDDESCSCRKIDHSSGLINVVAGDGFIDGYNGDSGGALTTYLSFPMGLCVDHANGNIIIADMFNNRIRKATQPGYVSTTGTPVIVIPEADIYPNPSTGRFLISVTDDRKLSSMKILNTAGDVVSSSLLSTNQTTVDLSLQPAGMYFLQISSAAGTTTQKLILTR